MKLLKKIFLKPITIAFAIIIAIVLGIVSTTKMAVNLLPNIAFPYLAVQTTYVGASAEVVDKEVTIPLENKISKVSGIHEISTYSLDNASVIIVQFDYGTDTTKKEKEILTQINELSLPNGVNEPTISTIDLNATSLYSLTVFSETESIDEVYKKTLELESKLSSINGVASIKYSGAPKVTINVDMINGLEMLSGLLVQGLMTNASYDIPLGDIIKDGDKITINNHSKAETIEEIKSSIVSLELSNSEITMIESVQDYITKIEEMNVEETIKYKEDANRINDFIDELESSSNEELDDLVSNLSTIKTFVSLIENYSSASLKLMWSSTLKPLFENEDFKNMNDNELHNVANDLGVSYDLVKWLHDNSEVNPLTGKTYAEEKWQKIVDFRKENETEEGELKEDFTDSKFVSLFYEIEIVSDDVNDENYMSPSDIEDAIEFSRNVNTVALNTVVDHLKNEEEVSNQEYANIFIYEGNDIDLPLNSQTIEFIRNEHFDENYQVFYSYKLNHEHEETIINEETGLEETIKVGDEIPSVDFIDMYERMTFDNEAEVKPTTRLLDFIRKVDSTSNTLKIKVDDVADVYLNTKYESKAFYNSKMAIQLDIFGDAESNASAIAKEAKEIIEEFNKNNDNYVVVSLNNQADFINDSLSNALISLIIGCLLAIVVIYLFLRKVKSSLIIGLSMPLSVLLTLVVLYAMGITLNMVSIGGIAVGIGMLVDNSIVVLESITSEKEKGKNVLEASIDGVKLVIGSLIGSTLTSICVFFPILFIEGLTKEVFSDLSWAVILSLSFSLLVAVVVIPTLFCLFYRKNEKKEHTEGKLFKKLEIWYAKHLGGVLKHKFVSILVVLGVFLSSIGLVFTCSVEFLPSIDQHRIQVNINFEGGTDNTYCQNKTQEAYQLIMNNIDDIDYMSQSVGFAGLIETNQSGVITIQLKDNAKKTKEVCEDLRTILNNNDFSEEYSIVELDGVVASLTGGMNGVSVSISGDDVETLKEISNKIEDLVEAKDGIRNASNNMLSSSISYDVKFDQEALIENGLDYSILVQTLRIGLAGYDVYEIVEDNVSADVTITWKEDTIGDYYNNLLDLIVGIKNSTDGSDVEFVHLRDVASINEEYGRHVIRKLNGQNVLTITVEYYGIDTNTASKYLTNATKDILKDYEGYSFNEGGVSYYLNDAFSGLFIALIISFFLLFGIMACLFESIRKPIIIIFSFPFAFAGGFLALAISRVSLNVVSFIGLIMLMGVIINDAIVLNERFDQLRESGLNPKDAVIEGAKQRLRAVLMTTLTTVLALIPIALGLGSGGELMQPLGVVAIGGMTIGTFVTLILIPCVYSVAYRIDFSDKKKNNKEVSNKNV